MKNSFKLLSVIALVAIIGFSVTACREPDYGNNRNTQTEDVFRLIWQGAVDGLPPTGQAGWVYFNRNDSKAYVWFDGGWNLFAVDGAPGEKGDKGDTGTKGDKGEQGLPGENGTHFVWFDTEPVPPYEVDGFYYDEDIGIVYIYLNGEKNIFGRDGNDGNTPVLELNLDVATGELTYTIDGGTPIPLGNIKGPQGPKGEDGISIAWQGSYESAEELIEAKGTPQLNWAYFNTSENTAYIWAETAVEGEYGWQILVEGVDGIPGEKGADGTPIIWQGAYPSAAELLADKGFEEPQLNWAYYNNTVNIAYIWAETETEGVFGWLTLVEGPPPPLPHLLVITAEPVKTVYVQGEAFTSSGLTAVVSYNGIVIPTRAFALIWNGAAITNGNTAITAELGEKSVTVTDTEGRTDTFTITVIPVENSIRFDPNGAARGTSPSAIAVSVGSSITLPNQGTLVKAGYTFGGWNTAANGMGFTYTAGSSFTITNSTTILYAKWDATVTYTVSFDPNSADGAASPPVQNIFPGSVITLPGKGTLVKTGYSFGGWNTLADGSGYTYAAGSSYTVTGNATLYAKWSSRYTVTFSANNATSGTIPNVQNAEHGDSITLPNQGTLARTGHTFNGWNTNPQGTGHAYSAGDALNITDSLILYAIWNPNSYTVSFDVNGATGGTAPAGIGGVYSSNITLPGQGSLTRTGHTFGGWNTNASGTGTNYAAGSSYTITVAGDVTLYAKWNPIEYTVTFNVNGGSGTVPTAQIAAYGTNITLPSGSGLSRTGMNFGGWNTNTSGTGTNYSANTSYTVTGNVTLYARWNRAGTTVQGATLADKFTWLNNNIASNSTYFIDLDEDQGSPPRTISWSGISNVTIYLTGIGTARTIDLSSSGSMFTVGSGFTLVLDNITLQGRSSNNNSVVVINSGGTFVMNAGSHITGNSISAGNANHGGGVRVDGGTFTMNGGTISGNTTVSSSTTVGNISHGGGVLVVSGTFNMNNGTISGNITSNTGSGNAYGGGIRIHGGIFNMTGGTISGNTASITSTSSNYSARGGGVSVGDNGTFNMSGGTISGNTVISATATTSNAFGGGVSVSGTFTKTGGTINGYTAGNSNSNVSQNNSGTVFGGSGHAVYALGATGGVKRMETTAGPSVNLAYNRSANTWSGGWDF